MKKFLSSTYMAIILLFMYIPIVALIILSFNSSKYMSTWTGFSFRWYGQLLSSTIIKDALRNTLIIAFLSATIATILGTVASIGINNMKKMPKTITMGITNIPMLNAEIVTAISLMLVFIAIGLKLGFLTILIGHITFNLPYVILSVMPRLKQTEISTYEAALDLGASPFKAFMKVVLPDIMPGVTSGFLLAFTMSLDDFVITHFTKGSGINTLSTLIYSEVRKGIKPSLYALSTIMFITVIIILFIANKPKKSEQ
ncbi:MAG: ABC transporter permease [Lachnospiraceae bacterium]|nr:ABC transporter permease [Lachnospiraceae bacterium]